MKGNRANDDVRGLHTSLVPAKKKKPLKQRGLKMLSLTPLPDTSQAYAPTPSNFQAAEGVIFIPRPSSNVSKHSVQRLAPQEANLGQFECLPR